MKKLIYILAQGALISLTLAACSKKDNNTTPPANNTAATVFANQKLQPKTVTIDAGNDASFYGNSGTRYIFSANSLQTANGTGVTGNVQMQVTEYLQKGDMIFSKMLPISGSEPLLSAGELNITATQNGQTLYLKPGTTFRANVPGNSTNMILFKGIANEDTTVSIVNWRQAKPDSNIGVVVIGNDTTSIISDSLGQCNADYFMTNPDYQNFTVTVAGVTLPANTQVLGYTLYDDYKAVWPLGLIGSYANGVFTEQHVPNIPVHFAVFTVINGTFYGGTLGATPSTGSNYTVTLSQIDPTTFKQQLNSL